MEVGAMHLRQIRNVAVVAVGLLLLGCEALDDPSKIPPGSPDVDKS